MKNKFIAFIILGLVLLSKPSAVLATGIALTGKAKVLNTANSYLDFTNYNSNVTVDDTTGNFSGYAFLEDLGWAAFGTTDNSLGPVNLNLTTGAVTGKAKILNTGNSYLDFTNYNSNVTVALATGVFTGYAFSEDVGWLDFSDTGVSSASPFLPTAPSGFSGTADSSTAITWSWTDNSSNETGFKIYDSADALITTISAANTQSWQETGLTKGTTYTRYVAAYSGAGNSSSSGNISVATKTSQPDSFDLQSPGNNDYTNNERPTFKWEDSADSDDGMNKYVLEVDNPSLGSDQPSGDFTIDDIPPSRTTDYETSKYLIHYENFSDSDNSNNYISVYTKETVLGSASNNSEKWSEAENGGKLREGKISWKVKAVDNAGNEREESRTLFVDRTGPSVEANQLNNFQFSIFNSQSICNDSICNDQYSTTDTTPVIYGKITDSLAGPELSNGQKQDENGPKIASGPKEAEIKIESQGVLGIYKLYSLATVNLSDSYWGDKGDKIEDNSKNRASKYSSFSYTPVNNLDYGIYKITISGKDKAGNGSASSSQIILNITTFEKIAKTPEMKKIIDEVEQETGKSREEIEKQAEEIFQQGMIIPEELKELSVIAEAAGKIFTGIANLWWKTVDTGRFLAGKIGQGLAFAGDKTEQLLALRKQKNIEAKTELSKVYYDLAQKSPGVMQDGLAVMADGAGEVYKTVYQKASSLAYAWRTSSESVVKPASQETLKFTNRFKTAANVFASILFDKEPTIISGVKVDEKGRDYAVIIWQTNHYADSKVSYGATFDYGNDVQSNERVKNHRIKITGLEPGVEYKYEVMSQGKNYVYDARHEFRTLEQE